MKHFPTPAGTGVQSFLDVPFTPLTFAEAIEWVVARDPAAPFAFVTTPNAQHVVAVANGDERYRTAHRAAALVLNDSAILLRLARRLFGFDLPQVAGSDLTVALLNGHIRPDDTLTIIGGSAETVVRLRERFGIRSIARHDPPMGFVRDPAEIAKCADFIAANPARYVFIVTSCPQSEMVAMEVLRRGGATGTALCVGSGLDAAVELVKRAPLPWRRLGLEWLYRLGCNPKRHFRRVFVQSMPVLLIAARAWLKRA